MIVPIEDIGSACRSDGQIDGPVKGRGEQSVAVTVEPGFSGTSPGAYGAWGIGAEGLGNLVGTGAVGAGAEE